jgi:hypothetical protein
VDFSEGSVTFEAPKGEITKKLPVFYDDNGRLIPWSPKD